MPVFDGKVEAKPTEQAFILNFSSADAAESVKQVEYVTTYTELDGNEMKTFLLGTELIPEGWQDGSYSQVPYEDWYALGEHFITLESVSFEAKSELTGYDTYTYKIYAAVGDNHGKETLAQLQAIRTVVPGDTSSTGMILTGASPIMQEGDDNAPRALMPEDIDYIRPAVTYSDNVEKGTGRVTVTSLIDELPGTLTGTFQDNGVEGYGAFRSLGYPQGDIKLSASRLPQADESYLTTMTGASDTLEECLTSASIGLGVRNEDGLYVPSSLRDSVALKLLLPQDSDVEALNGHMRAFILSEETGEVTESDFVLAVERNGEKYVVVHATQLGYIGVYCAEPSEPSAFTDVPAGAYYADAVTWALNNGVTAGTGDGTTFSPDTGCTHGQCVTFLYRDLA